MRAPAARHAKHWMAVARSACACCAGPGEPCSGATGGSGVAGLRRCSCKGAAQDSPAAAARRVERAALGVAGFWLAVGAGSLHSAKGTQRRSAAAWAASGLASLCSTRAAVFAQLDPLFFFGPENPNPSPRPHPGTCSSGQKSCAVLQTLSVCRPRCVPARVSCTQLPLGRGPSAARARRPNAVDGRPLPAAHGVRPR